MLPVNVSMGAVSLFVPDLDRSSRFYTEVLGFKQLASGVDSRRFGAEDGTEILELVERPTWIRPGRRSPGLFHFAVLFPSRASLGKALTRLLESGGRLSGAGDHLVSEALYLEDPDGNGIELYVDRPRSTWEFHNGQVHMDTLSVDIESLIAEAAADPAPWTGLPAGTRMGHVHLKVGDLTAAGKFYTDVIGFDVMATMPQALFVAAGGYHHHLGLNTWMSNGSPPPAPESLGLNSFIVNMTDPQSLHDLESRLSTAGVAFEKTEKEIQTTDPSGNRMRIRGECLSVKC